MVDPRRGEIYLATLDPVQGHEQAGRRPVVIVSHDRMKRSTLVYAVPLTRTKRDIPWHVEVGADAGLKRTSFALCEQMRSLSVARLLAGPFGRVPGDTMREIEARLRVLLDL